MLATPLFVSLPVVSRRTSGGAYRVGAGGDAQHAVVHEAAGYRERRGSVSAACVILAAMLFRERERIAMWLAVALPGTRAWFVPASVIGAPVMQFGPGGMARLHAVNATSVLMLFVVLVLQVSRAVTKGRFGAGSSAGLVWSLNWLIWRSLSMSLPRPPPGYGDGSSGRPDSHAPRPGMVRGLVFQHGGRAENTVITEKERPRRRGLHHVATEAVHQAWHVEVQQQADVDAAHAEVRAELHLMDREDGGDGFDLQDNLVGDDDIRLKPSPTAAPL